MQRRNVAVGNNNANNNFNEHEDASAHREDVLHTLSPKEKIDFLKAFRVRGEQELVSYIENKMDLYDNELFDYMVANDLLDNFIFSLESDYRKVREKYRNIRKFLSF
jgi:hypothetical protein